MRKGIARIICIAMMFTSLCLSMDAMAENKAIILPSNTEVVAEEAFMGNTSITEVVMPQGVTSVEKNAFSGCTSLNEVTVLGLNTEIDGAAFEGCSGLAFNAFQGSKAELFALAHGFSCTILGDESPTYQRVMNMVSEYGGMQSVTQGKESERLIVRMKTDRLPDISAYHPVSIVRDGDSIFFIQFSTPDDTGDCYDMLDARKSIDVKYVEYDLSAAAFDKETVSGAGYVSWDDDDPMGFDEYATYVANNQSGSQLIAVVDSGINSHSSYSGKLSSKSFNMLDDGQSDFYDGRRHGSVIASIIAECVGDANVGIMSVRVVDNQGQTSPSILGQGIAYAVESGANIINLSMKTDSSEYVIDKINMAMDHNIIVIVSAGNDPDKSTSSIFPANVSGTIVVSGLQDPQTLWSGSSTGNEVDFCAPAVGISTTAYKNNVPGTSFSAPMIAAAYALVKLDPDHSISDMERSCDDLGVEGKDRSFGYGLPRLDKLAALLVTKVSIEGDVPAVLKINDTYTLNYCVEPLKALDRTVSCTSSKPDVISVEAGEGDSFTLRAVGKGKSTITVKANDASGKKESVDIQVVQPVESITITADTDELPMTRTLPLAINVVPDSADNKKVNWGSSNEAVAIVSSEGLVTPVSAGTVVIRADAQDGYGAYDEMTINVIEIPDPEEIEVYSPTRLVLPDETFEMKPGEKIQFQAKVFPNDAPQDITWKASSNGVVSVDSTGYVTANKSGSGYIVATAVNRINQIFMIQVVVPPTGIAIGGDSIVNVGETIALTATVSPANADNQTVHWEPSDPTIATVDQNGVVTGVSNGEVIITATADGDDSVMQTKEISVRQMPKEISITGDTNIFKGYGSHLKAEFVPSDTYDKTVTWTSDNEAVATVDADGNVTAVGPGTAVITATSNADPGIAMTANVRVKNEWTAWTGWSTNPVEATENMQVETRKQYRSRTISYGGWSGWSEFVAGTANSSDTMYVDAKTVWRWGYYTCSNSNCSFHCWTSGITCPKWAGGCGTGYVNSSNWHEFYLPYDHNAGEWNFEGVGANRVRYTDNQYGYGTIYGVESDHSGRQGYRYQTRTKNESDWSDWSTTPIEPITTNDYQVIVDNPRTQYRSRLRNSFDESIVSGWVTMDQVPADATIVNTKWVYTEKLETTVPNMEGWTLTGDTWKQTGSGYTRRVDFSQIPGFNTSHALYNAYNVSAPSGYNNGTSKREVSSYNDGYIYWHWMYSVNESAYDRAIFYQNGYGSSSLTGNSFYYYTFQAHESYSEYEQMSKNWAQERPKYIWYRNKSDHQSNGESGGSWYWYKTQIVRYNYTDYVKNYVYTRTSESTVEPTANANITSITKYVCYSLD